MHVFLDAQLLYSAPPAVLLCYLFSYSTRRDQSSAQIRDYSSCAC